MQHQQLSRKAFFPANGRVLEAPAGRGVPVLQARAGCCWVLWAPCQARAATALTCFSKIWATKKVNYIFKFLSVVKSCNCGLKLTVLHPAINWQRGFAGSKGGLALFTISAHKRLSKHSLNGAQRCWQIFPSEISHLPMCCTNKCQINPGSDNQGSSLGGMRSSVPSSLPRHSLRAAAIQEEKLLDHHPVPLLLLPLMP